MNYLKVNNKNIYYNIEGSGKPILILNGIMMSTKSWDPFVKTLTNTNTLIRLDFFDQGVSDKLDENYDQSIQTEVIKALLEHLEIDKINIVGISYGGEVALDFATKYPNKIDRLILFNTTPYTSPLLKEIGKQWNEIGETRNGSTYYKATIPIIYSPSFYESNLEWMKKREQVLIPIFSNETFLKQMERLVNSAENFDVRAGLHKIDAPTLIVASDEDYLTPLANQKYLAENIKNANLIILPGVGHASMYETPLVFVSLVLGFVNALETDYNI